MASLNDLLAQKAALEKQIAEAQRAERGEAIARVKALMAEYGLSLADLGPRPVGPAPRRAGGGSSNGGSAGSAGSGRKVPPKYRHPETGQTWSGRGLKPTWLAKALADGRSLQDFAV